MSHYCQPIGITTSLHRIQTFCLVTFIMDPKQYGLIKLQKPTVRLMAFASDSDSDSDAQSKKKVSIVASSSQKRRAKIIQDDALKEDPTIFQYDEVYDEMAANREEAKKAKTTEVKEAKYINRLMVAAEKRKLENESRMERKVQKERDAEGDKYSDKEVFVTSAYRAKLEALKKAEEESRREEYLEQIGDVTKQKDLGGFYRHFYEQKLGADEKPPNADEEKTVEKTVTKSRKYRRHSEHDSSDEHIEDESIQRSKADVETSERKKHIQSNIDADSDFSIDSSDSEDSEEKSGEAAKASLEVNATNTSKQAGRDKEENNLEESSKSMEPESPKETETKDKTLASSSEADDKEKMPAPPPPPPKKPKIDIWKKRTVDDVYLAAVQRYYERKQQMTVA